MSSTVRRLALTGALVAALAAPSAAAAQDPFEGLPGLSAQPPQGIQGGGTPAPTATPAATPTATPEATGTPAASATPAARPGREDLPTTGSDALTLALAGVSLLAFGASLRLQLALRDGRV